MATLIIGKLLSKLDKFHPEHSRKFIHISAGIAAAALPFFLGFGQIVILAAVFTPPMILTKHKKLMSALAQVKRKTFGEVFFSVGVLLTALLFPHIEAYVFGILVMALADGFASVLGARFGKRGYTVFGQKKTFFGSGVFFVVTVSIGLAMLLAVDRSIDSSIVPLVFVSGILAYEEALLAYGADNIFIPVTAAGLYQLVFL